MEENDKGEMEENIAQLAVQDVQSGNDALVLRVWFAASDHLGIQSCCP